MSFDPGASCEIVNAPSSFCTGSGVAVIPPREAIFTLVRSTYQAAWMHETGASGRNLQHCGDLVRSGVVRRLRRRKRFDVLPDVLRFIEADVRS